MTRQMVPSLFEDGNGKLKKKYGRGIYLIGRVDSSPLREGRGLIPPGAVKLSWLRMGLLDDLAGAGVKISYQQTHCRVKHVDSVRRIFERAVYQVPAVQRIHDAAALYALEVCQSNPHVDVGYVRDLFHSMGYLGAVGMLQFYPWQIVHGTYHYHVG